MKIREIVSRFKKLPRIIKIVHLVTAIHTAIMILAIGDFFFELVFPPHISYTIIMYATGVLYVVAGFTLGMLINAKYGTPPLIKTTIAILLVLTGITLGLDADFVEISPLTHIHILIGIIILQSVVLGAFVGMDYQKRQKFLKFKK